MMEAAAKLRYLRMSPRKVRLVADLIRGKNIGDALDILKYLDKKAAKPVSLLVQSAAANAGNKEGMDTESLYVSSITVDEGPMWKRYMPRSRGMAYPILKKTSHLNIIIKDRPGNQKNTKVADSGGPAVQTPESQAQDAEGASDKQA